MSANRYAQDRGIPVSSMYYHLGREAGGLPSLIDRRKHNGRRSEVAEEVLVWTLAFLAQNRRATLAGAWREVQKACGIHGWKKPSYPQIVRVVNRLPADLRALMVHGARHHFETWGIVRRKEEHSINGLWQIDASELPVWCLDPSTGETFKPWTIGIVEVCSRVTMAMWLCRNTPDTGQALLALRHAILPKHDERFPFFGLPGELQSDSGAIFKSADFQDALLRMGIKHVPTENDCPSANGKIERLFRTVQDGLVRNLTQFSEQYRGLQSAKRTPLPFPLLGKMLDSFLVEYHLRKHASLDKAPWEAWHDGLAGARGFDLSPQDVVDACKVRVDKRVHRDGVELTRNAHYSAPELAGLVGKTVTLRVLPDGGDTTTPCFYKGAHIADLQRVEGNSELGEAIKHARLDRAKELARLRKTLLKTAARVLPNQPATLPPGAKPIAPKPDGDVPLEPMDIPDLPEDEE